MSSLLLGGQTLSWSLVPTKVVVEDVYNMSLSHVSNVLKDCPRKVYYYYPFFAGVYQ